MHLDWRKLQVEIETKKDEVEELVDLDDRRQTAEAEAEGRKQYVKELDYLLI